MSKEYTELTSGVPSASKQLKAVRRDALMWFIDRNITPAMEKGEFEVTVHTNLLSFTNNYGSLGVHGLMRALDNLGYRTKYTRANGTDSPYDELTTWWDGEVDY